MLKSRGGLSILQRWNMKFESSKQCRIHPLCDLYRLHEIPPHVFKDTSKKDLATRACRLGGRRYNRSALQIERVYFYYFHIAILGNEASIETPSSVDCFIVSLGSSRCVDSKSQKDDENLADHGQNQHQSFLFKYHLPRTPNLKDWDRKNMGDRMYTRVWYLPKE
jgi:hypothetical protein